VTEKPHNAVVKFNTYRNLQRHRAVLPAIARLLFSSVVVRGISALGRKTKPLQLQNIAVGIEDVGLHDRT